MYPIATNKKFRTKNYENLLNGKPNYGETNCETQFFMIVYSLQTDFTKSEELQDSINQL